MEGEAARAALAEQYPEWRVWRNGTVAYAWWVKSSPQILLTDSTFAGFKERIPLAVDAWNRTKSWKKTMKAARQPIE